MRLNLIKALEELEGAPQKTREAETEITLYAHVGNVEGLQQFDQKEEHIQLEDHFTDGTRCRVRKTTKADGEESYVFTYKLKTKAEDGGELASACIENNAVVDQSFFEGFEKIASRHIVKTRYVFNSKKVEMTLHGGDGEPVQVMIPNVKYETDIFHGSPREDGVWCKIDIEVDSILAFLAQDYPTIKDISLTLKVSHLPFQPDSILLGSSEDENVKAKIKDLWSTFMKPQKDQSEEIPTSISEKPETPTLTKE